MGRDDEPNAIARLTAAELQQMGSLGGGDGLARAVAEIRRLRGLIAGVSPDRETICISCAYPRPRHEARCPWLAIDAEAEAIRAEESHNW